MTHQIISDTCFSMYQQMRFCVLRGSHFCVYCGYWCEYELDLTMSQTPISNKTARQWQSVFSDKNCFSLTQSKEKCVHGFGCSRRRLPIFTFTFIRWWERLSFIQIQKSKNQSPRTAPRFNHFQKTNHTRKWTASNMAAMPEQRTSHSRIYTNYALNATNS